MGVPVDSGNERWGWEGEPPTLTEKQSALLEATIDEVRASPLSSSVKVDGARSAVWRYLVAAQWRLEQAGGKRVSDFFVDTLKWRQEEGVDGILAQAQTFGSEASSGKLFVHGTCVMKRPLIWFHLGRENNALDPEANERAIANMERAALNPEGGKGQFCVVIDCSQAGAGGQLPSLAFIRRAVSMLMLRYPSRLGNMFIVNAGLAVYYLWQAISVVLAQRREMLLEHMSAEALEGGRLGCAGAPPFNAELYLAGGDAGGRSTSEASDQPS
eukprot:jgi/Undpi1/5879/HiC_scaffold_2.g01153.m1